MHSVPGIWNEIIVEVEVEKGGGGGGGEIAVSFLPISSSSLFRPVALSRVTLIQFQLCLWQL